MTLFRILMAVQPCKFGREADFCWGFLYFGDLMWSFCSLHMCRPLLAEATFIVAMQLICYR